MRAGCGKAINHCQTELNNQFNCLEEVAVRFSWLMSRFDKIFLAKSNVEVKSSLQLSITYYTYATSGPFYHVPRADIALSG